MTVPPTEGYDTFQFEGGFGLRLPNNEAIIVTIRDMVAIKEMYRAKVPTDATPIRRTIIPFQVRFAFDAVELAGA